jgi:hypothetical protein
MKERYRFGEQGIERRIILKWIFKDIWWQDVDWNHVAKDRVQWRALV